MKLTIKICKDVVDKKDFLDSLKDIKKQANFYIFTDNKNYLEEIKSISDNFDVELNKT